MADEMKYDSVAYAMVWGQLNSVPDISGWSIAWGTKSTDEKFEQGADMSDFLSWVFGLDASRVYVIYVKDLCGFATILSAYAGFDEKKSFIGGNPDRPLYMRLFLKDISWIEMRDWDNFFEKTESLKDFLEGLDYCRTYFSKGRKNKLGLGKHFVFTLRRDLWEDITAQYKLFSGWAKRNREEMAPTCEEELDLYQRVYKGSYFFLNPIFKGIGVPNVNNYDISSSHIGFISRKKYPSGTAKEATEEEFGYVFSQDFCYIGEFILEGVVPRTEMPMKLSNFGICDNLNRWHLVLTDVHMKALKRLYRFSSLTVKKLFYFPKNYLDRNYAKMCIELYEEKQQAKQAYKEGNASEIVKNLFKLRAELVYGMSIKNPGFYDIESCYDETINQFGFDRTERQVDFDSIVKKLKTRTSLPFQVGIWTAAYSFAEEIDMMLGVGVDNAIYGDTDSIKFVNSNEYVLKHNEEIKAEKKKVGGIRGLMDRTTLGEWIEETPYSLFKAIGIKWYIGKYANGVYNFAAAGANLSALDVVINGGFEEHNSKWKHPIACFSKDMRVPQLFVIKKRDKEKCILWTGYANWIGKQQLDNMRQQERVI